MVTRAGAAELGAGRAFVDLSSWRAVAVTGADAVRWLHNLVSADVDDLVPGRARRSLLLAPTGGVIASFTVSVPDDTLVLFQDPREPRPVDRLLAPYVLSSDVRIEDRSADMALFAFPGRTEPPEVPGTTASAPSVLGPGSDAVGAAEDRARLAHAFGQAAAAADEDAAETWRILAGVPVVGLDTADGDLPQECGLEGAVSFGKGCFLGQEAVAKVRNLGHPRRLLLRLEGDAPLAPGEPVRSGDREVGTITSAAWSGDRWVSLARVGWDDRDADLISGEGAALRRRA